jgi:hypothetical protein
MFLAWVPSALPDASGQSGLLELEDYSKRHKRPNNKPHVTHEGMASFSSLGALAETSARSCAARKNCIEQHSLLIQY